MAVALGDAGSGFRHSEIVLFINEEVLNNGGGPDFYATFSARPWSEIEDELRCIVTDPQVPLASKRACAWSALALGVRVGARQREEHARGVRQLQERLQEHEATAWALASQLQRLREERDWLLWQFRQAREDLQRAQDQREAARGQLLLAEKRRQQTPQLLGYDAWPRNVEERNQVLAKMWQRRLDADSQKERDQMASTMDAVYLPRPPDPQMPPGVVYPPGRCPAVGSEEEVALQCGEESQGQEEGPVKPHFINPSEHSCSQDPTSEKQQPQGSSTQSSRNLYAAEEPLAPSV